MTNPREAVIVAAIVIVAGVLIYKVAKMIGTSEPPKIIPPDAKPFHRMNSASSEPNLREQPQERKQVAKNVEIPDE